MRLASRGIDDQVLKPGCRFLLRMPPVNMVGFRGCCKCSRSRAPDAYKGRPRFIRWLARFYISIGRSKQSHNARLLPCLRPRSRTLDMKNASRRDRCGLGAFSIYMSLSILFFGRGLIGHLTTRVIGKDVGDPGAHIWFLEWLPHALVGGHNPIFTTAIWAPAGINLSWTTWIPFEAILAWPVTATLGPVASYNLLSLVSLALAAWSAFLLCRQVGAAWAGSLMGGYIFAFSGYMISYLWVGDLCAISVFQSHWLFTQRYSRLTVKLVIEHW